MTPTHVPQPPSLPPSLPSSFPHPYRETCLCKTCYNLKFYREGLGVLGKVLGLLIEQQREAGEVVADDGAADGAEAAGGATVDGGA